MPLLKPSPKKPRAYAFDNLKCILIFLAVLGHLLTISPDWGGWNEGLYRLIYSFHMPAFLFITGWFAVYKRRTIIFHLAWLYLLFQTIHRVFFLGLLPGEPIELVYTTPAWSLWYLMVTLFCYLLIPLFNVKGKRRRSCVLTLFFFLSMCYGLDPTIGKFLSLGRLFSFLPFFAMGFYARDWQDRILAGPPRAVKIALTSLVFLVSWWLLFDCPFPKEAFYGSHSFERLGIDVAAKVLIQLIACLWLFFLLLVVVPALNRPLPVVSAVGRNTLAVYLLHAFPVKLLEFWDLTASFAFWQTLLTAVVIVVALGNDVVGKVFSKVFTGWWIERLWDRMEPKRSREDHFV